MTGQGMARRLTPDELDLTRQRRLEAALAFCIDAIEEHLARPNNAYLRRAMAMARGAYHDGQQRS